MSPRDLSPCAQTVAGRSPPVRTSGRGGATPCHGPGPLRQPGHHARPDALERRPNAASRTPRDPVRTSWRDRQAVLLGRQGPVIHAGGPGRWSGDDLRESGPSFGPSWPAASSAGQQRTMTPRPEARRPAGPRRRVPWWPLESPVGAAASVFAVARRWPARKRPVQSPSWPQLFAVHYPGADGREGDRALDPTSPQDQQGLRADPRSSSESPAAYPGQPWRWQIRSQAGPREGGEVFGR